MKQDPKGCMKMKRTFITVLGALSMAAMMALSSCGSSDSSTASDAAKASGEDKSWSKVESAGKLVLGLDATFKPMGYTDENDEIVGFDIDCAKEVCSRLGIELPIELGYRTAKFFSKRSPQAKVRHHRKLRRFAKGNAPTTIPFLKRYRLSIK